MANVFWIMMMRCRLTLVHIDPVRATAIRNGFAGAVRALLVCGVALSGFEVAAQEPGPDPAAPAQPSTGSGSAQPAAPASGSNNATSPQAPVTAPSASPTAVNRANAELITNLLRTTLVALHQADVTGNYTVLRDLASPGFRDRNSASDLSQIFAWLRQQRVDLSTVTVSEPQLTRAAIEDKNALHLTGWLATKPIPVAFELLFLPIAGVWRVDGIAISPMQPQSAAATPPTPEPMKVPDTLAPKTARPRHHSGSSPQVSHPERRPAKHEAGQPASPNPTAPSE